MIQRHLYETVFAQEWGRQMRFITGPRQVGKTTLARQKLAAEHTGNLYYLWDLRSVRQRYKENELFFTADAMPGKKRLWVCFDEIHKMPKWKNMLKGIFDETAGRYGFIITGSAKLNLLRHAGDSLAGRYFTFHLLPLTLSEINKRKPRPAAADPQTFIRQALDGPPAPHDSLTALLEHSGFPEPFLHQSKRFHNKWALEYVETVVREDIGSLTRIVEREHLFDLQHLLPEMVGSPLSVASLASHVQASHVTVKNYLRRLEDFYLAFCLRPYSTNIKRSLLKAGKYYLYDWSRIPDAAARFENLVACELNARLHLWSEAAGQGYGLFYIRNKQKQETDFLITRSEKPWLLVETKLKDGPIDRHHFETAAALGDIAFVQVCREPGIACLQKKNACRISADRLFG
jgi:uncharacterized protein